MENDEFSTYFWPEIKFKCHTIRDDHPGGLFQGSFPPQLGKTKPNKILVDDREIFLNLGMEIIDANNPSPFENVSKMLFELKFNSFLLLKKRKKTFS